MTTVKSIFELLNTKAPVFLKMDFDNVGLLCGHPEREVTSVLVVLDITSDAIQEAKELGAELIVSHHPLIFTPMKRILSDDENGARVLALLENGLSAICMHTNLDVVSGGVNSALAAAVGARELAPLSECGCVAELPESMDALQFAKTVKKALQAEGVRFSPGRNKAHRLAVCGGAGGDIVFEASRLGCDSVLTGEIKHHEWIAGRELGLNMIDAGHFATENVVTPVLQGWLCEAFPELRVHLSSRQKGFFHAL